MNLDTWIKNILKDTWVGGTLTKYLPEVILKNTGKIQRIKLEDFTAEEKHLLVLIKLLLDKTVR